MGNSLERLRELKAKYRQDILSKQGVNAFAIGFKYIAGKRTTEVCLQVFVKEKLPLAKLAPEAIVPPFIEEVKTDVIEAEIPQAYSRTDKHRPAPGGVSIGHWGIGSLSFGSAGTLGFVWGNSKLIFSNNHVLANKNNAFAGEEILQPGTIDEGWLCGDRIARLYDFEPIYFYPAIDGAPSNVNIIDAAVALPVDPADVSTEILEIGTPVGFTIFELGQTVKKSGRTTGLTQGEVTSISWEGWVSYGEVGYAYFEEQYRVDGTDVCAGGDSGSAVIRIIDGNVYIGGLLFAGGGSGDDRYLIASPIQPIMERFPTDVLPFDIEYGSITKDTVYDTHLNEQNPDTNYSEEHLKVKSLVNGNTHTLIGYGSIGNIIPEKSTLLSALLRVYYYSKSGAVEGRIIQGCGLWNNLDWLVWEATWNDYKAGSAWSKPGGQWQGGYPVEPITEIAIPSTPSQWMEWEMSKVAGTFLRANRYIGYRPISFLIKWKTEDDPTGYQVSFANWEFGWAAELILSYEIATLPPIPIVTTQPPSSVEQTSAIGNGTIVDTGVGVCDQQGVEWGLSSGNYYASSIASDTFGVGSFTRLMQGLSAETTYYYRAKAHNSAGWGYGNEVTFTTLTADADKLAYDAGNGIEGILDRTITRADTGEGAESYKRTIIAEIATLVANYSRDDIGSGLDALLDRYAGFIYVLGADSGEGTEQYKRSKLGEVSRLLATIAKDDAGLGSGASTGYGRISGDAGIGTEVLLNRLLALHEEGVATDEIAQLIIVVTAIISSDSGIGRDVLRRIKRRRHIKPFTNLREIGAAGDLRDIVPATKRELPTEATKRDRPSPGKLRKIK